MRVESYPQKIPLKEPFVLAHGTYHFREALIIELIDDGISGFGEATAISYYGKTLEDFQKLIENHKKEIESIVLSEEALPSASIPLLFSKESFLQSAIDCAFWDVWAKKKGQPLYELLPQQKPALSAFTLSGEPSAIKKALEKGAWPIYKVKLGGEHDAEIISLLKVFAKKYDIRIDANGGWDLEQASVFIPELLSLGITFIEQPLPPEQDEQMPVLHRFKQAQYWADESAQQHISMTQLARYFYGINFKLMKSGGISPVIQHIKTARAAGLQVGLGCMTETSFGISALAQIAGLADYLDMDGNILLASDPATGAYIDAGRVILPTVPGLGCNWRLDPSELHP